MPAIPRESGLDSTLALLKDPYRFISSRCRIHRADLFETRIMLRKTICMTGPEATELFYDESRFVRRGAAPLRLQKSLFGTGSVQSLDDAEHRHRKSMLMSIMAPERIELLASMTAEKFADAARQWAATEEVVLFDALHEPMLKAVCAWAGVPLADDEVASRSRDVVALFDAAGDVGPRHWRARAGRRRSNRWIEEVVRRIRDGRLDPPDTSAACTIALHRDADQQLLPERIAAVELLNVIRPTVAVSVYIVLAAHALHWHPECRRAGTDSEYRDNFVQEVRRYYPFFPAVVARVRRDFTWQDYSFPAGYQVLLDLYGTNHDLRTWVFPREFRPERFSQWDRSPYNFIPQGGGEAESGHRCAGEQVTIALMNMAVAFLLEKLVYEVPEQDLQIDFARLPALPRSRFRVRNVRIRD